MTFVFFLFMIAFILIEKLGYFKNFETDRIKRNWVDYRKNLVLTNFSKIHSCPKLHDMYIEKFPWWYPKHSFMVGTKK